MLLRNTTYRALMKMFVLLVIIHCVVREVVELGSGQILSNLLMIECVTTGNAEYL
jgi:hypothetical protein